MGTLSEWMRVLGLCGMYFTLAFLWEGIKSKQSSELVQTLPGWFLIGMVWAMMMVFEWRVLHGGIAVVFTIVIFALFALGLAQRRARKRREASSTVRT